MAVAEMETKTLICAKSNRAAKKQRLLSGRVETASEIAPETGAHGRDGDHKTDKNITELNYQSRDIFGSRSQGIMITMGVYIHTKGRIQVDADWPKAMIPVRKGSPPEMPAAA